MGDTTDVEPRSDPAPPREGWQQPSDEGEQRTTQYGPGFFTLDETAWLPPANEHFLVGPGVLTTGGKILLYGASGVGKSTLGQDLAACLAAPKAWLGEFEVPVAQRVLYVHGELAEAEVGSHGEHLRTAFGDSLAGTNLVFWLPPRLKLPRQLAVVRREIKRTQATVLFLDPFIWFFEGTSTAQPEQVHALFASLDELLRDPSLGLSGVVVVHHSNVREGRTAGSWAFEGWPSTLLRLDGVSGPERRITFEKVRAPGLALQGRRVQATLDHQGYRAIPFGPSNNSTVVEILQRSQTLGRGALRSAVMTEAGVRERQASYLMSNAVRSGEVTRRAVGRNAIYELTNRDPSDD